MEVELLASDNSMPSLIASIESSRSSVDMSPRAELSQANMSMSLSGFNSSPRGQGLVVSPEDVGGAGGRLGEGGQEGEDVYQVGLISGVGQLHLLPDPRQGRRRSEECVLVHHQLITRV